jgi:hypothetical protein
MKASGTPLGQFSTDALNIKMENGSVLSWYWPTRVMARVRVSWLLEARREFHAIIHPNVLKIESFV